MCDALTRGVFIVLEGGEGCGKDANIAYLKERYRDRSDVLFTREPGGTAIGERIREVLMDHASSAMAVEAELFLFLAARAQLVREVVRPALRTGTHVVANRFGLSTVAYQVYRTGRHEYRPFLDAMSAQVLGDLRPHYVLLDVDPAVGVARARARPERTTRFDVEPLEVHQRVRDGYREAVRAHPHTIIDAGRPLAEVREEVYAYVDRLLYAHPS